ncbi:hypothetical protein TNCV_2132181 [Trichonephila clavipes]|nr:hypothetical protein TNCV_2132181 [Trichonephila clavipes]
MDLSYHTPESKQQSMEWRYTSSPVKEQDYDNSVLGPAWCFAVVDIMPQGTPINSGAYCVNLRKLRRALQKACYQKVDKFTDKFDDDIQKVAPARAPIARHLPFSLTHVKSFVLFQKFKFRRLIHCACARRLLVLAACHNGHSDCTLSAEDWYFHGDQRRI